MSESGAPQTTNGAHVRNWDALAALIAALIGVMALLVSGYTAYIQRQQVRAQVWPHLLVGNYDPERAIGVLNKGVGPAIVDSVQVFIDGKPKRTWKQAFEALGLPAQGFMVSTVSSNVISAGERVVALNVADEAAYRNFATNSASGSASRSATARRSANAGSRAIARRACAQATIPSIAARA